jgi:molybdate transport system substrate-binding protein
MIHSSAKIDASICGQLDMMRSLLSLRICVAAAVLLSPGFARGADIKVLLSGAFTAAYNELIPEFERATGNKVASESGLGSLGTSPNSIPGRLQSGQLADVVILSRAGLDELVKQGKVRTDGRVDLVRSAIGMAVRAGAPKPDISSVDALKRTLLAAKSIAYSSSVSGAYVSTELYQRLGIADQALGKSKRIEGMVGIAIARGEAEIGFQQISELLPVEGITYLGPLPAEVQRVSVFSAGIVAGSKELAAANSLIEFLASPSARTAIVKSGLEPIASQ